MRSFILLTTLATSAATAQAQLSSCRQCATDCNVQTALESLRPGLFNLAQCWTNCGSVCFPKASSSSALIAPSTSPSAPAVKAALLTDPTSVPVLALVQEETSKDADKPGLPPLSIAAIVLGSVAMVTILSTIFTVRRRRFAREAENEKARRQSATPASARARSQFFDVPGFGSIDLKRDSSSINSNERDGVPTLGYTWEAYPSSPRSVAPSISERSVRPSGELRRSRSVSRLRSLRASMIGPKDMPISLPPTSSDEPTYEVYQCYDADSSSFFVGQLDGSAYYDEPIVVSATAPPSPKSSTPAPFEDIAIASATSSPSPRPSPSPPTRTRSLSVTRRPVPRYVPDEVEQDAYSSLGHDFISAVGHASTATHSP